MSEDIVVPVDRLRDAITATLEVGQAHGLPACSWRHAGDGNLHSTFLLDPRHADDVSCARAAARDLHELAVGLGGSISGEHGIGRLKRDSLELQLGDRVYELHRRIKSIFDPKDLMNPGKKR